MRAIALVSAAAISTACSGSPYENAPAALELSASLMLPAPSEAVMPDRVGGIFVVDGHPVSKENRHLVYLKPGVHGIRYMCPGWHYIDGLPGIRFEFSIGKRYKFVCAGRDITTVTIEPVGGA